MSINVNWCLIIFWTILDVLHATVKCNPFRETYLSFLEGPENPSHCRFSWVTTVASVFYLTHFQFLCFRYILLVWCLCAKICQSLVQIISSHIEPRQFLRHLLSYRKFIYPSNTKWQESKLSYWCYFSFCSAILNYSRQLLAYRILK